MTIYSKMKRARDIAKSRFINASTSDMELEKILNENGLGYEITGSSVSVASQENPLLNVSITIRVYESDGDDPEDREEYYSVIVEVDPDCPNFEKLAIEGSRRAKHLFLCCKLGVPVGGNMAAESPIPAQQATQTFEQIRRLTAQTI